VHWLVGDSGGRDALWKGLAAFAFSPSSDFADFGDVCVRFAAFLSRVFKRVPQDAIVVEVGVSCHNSATAKTRVRECPTEEIIAGVGRRAVSSGCG
jgi:hypothetical protein